MTTLKARNLSRGEVRRLLGLQSLLNGSFTDWLELEPLTETEIKELMEIVNDFRDYWDEGKVSEGQARFVSVAPLLKLAGYNRHPIKLRIEEDIARFYIEDEDTFISGRFDLIAVHKEQQTNVNTPLWVLVVESKNSEASEAAGVAQMLTYSFQSLEHQESVWGLVTNGKTYEFALLRRGHPPTYQFMPMLNLFESDRAQLLLQVLKAIAQS